ATADGTLSMGDDKRTVPKNSHGKGRRGCNESHPTALGRFGRGDTSGGGRRRDAKPGRGHDRANSPKGEDAKLRVRLRRMAGPPKTGSGADRVSANAAVSD